jgi:cobalamin biosynthesis protein CobD/CbiB
MGVRALHPLTLPLSAPSVGQALTRHIRSKFGDLHSLFPCFFPLFEITKVSLKSTEKEGRHRKLIPTEGGAMLVWCVVLLFLGLAAFMDSIFTFGDIFRRINSVMFMLVSLGLLVRTSTKIRLAKREGYEKRIEELEQQVAELNKREPKKELKKETAPVS